MKTLVVGSLIAAALAMASSSVNAACTVTNTFVSGTTALASQVNKNFADLANCALPASGGTLTGTTTLPGSGVITSAGNLGIGTSTPGTNFHVVGGGIFQSAANGSSGTELTLRHDRAGAILQSNDELGYMSFYGYDGSSWDRGAYILAKIDGIAPAAGSMPTRLTFHTTPNGASDSAERMRIDSSGNVGINLTSPTAKLDIFAPSTQTAANAIGLRLTGAQSVANANTYYGMYSNPTYTAASGTLVGFQGIRSIPQNTGGGTVTSLNSIYSTPMNTSTGMVTGMYGLQTVPENSGGGTTGNMYGVYSVPTKSGTGAVTNMYALYGRCDNTGASGTLGSCYGLYLDAPTTTSAITSKYGVYQTDSASANYFAGRVGIGNSSPGATLDMEATNTATALQQNHLFASFNFAPASNSTANAISGEFYTNVTDSGGHVASAFAIGSEGFANFSGTAGTLGSATGAANYTDNSSTGTITNAWGSLNRARNSSTGTIGTAIGAEALITNTATGTITTAYNLKASYSNGGTIGTWYGLYIPAISGTAPTTARYPLYVADTGSNYFAGNVGIGTATANHKLDVSGNIGMAASSYLNWGTTDGTSGYGIRDNAGTIQLKNNAGAWANITTSSDARLKKDVADLPEEEGLPAILKMRAVSFRWKDVGKDKIEGPQIGFIAQEVEKILPHGVTGNFGDVTINLGHGKKEQVKQARSFQYGQITAPLVKAVQELYVRSQASSHETAAQLNKRDDEIAELKEENKLLKEAVCGLGSKAAFCSASRIAAR